MTGVTDLGEARAARRRPADERDARREVLAESALAALGDLGYARVSLREIAARSDLSEEVVEDSFDDKVDLIIFCVRHYKLSCVHRYDTVVAESTTAEEVAAGFANKLVETLLDEAPMHRLWYDLRTQSLFEPAFREVVLEIEGWLSEMIWRVVERYAELGGHELGLSEAVTYGVFDGIFQRALLGHLFGQPGVLDDFRAEVVELMPMVLKPD
ncbi:TetR/AcrR family transcriptional regulator [Nocardioides ultimimeridianus]